MLRIAIGMLGLTLLASCGGAPQVPAAARSELAPTGKLRVGLNFGNRLFAARDAAGKASGIAVDLAHELGRQMGLPVELVGFDSGGQLTAGLKSGAWDVAFLAYEQAREKEIVFAGAFAEVDSTYLVPAGSKLRTADEVDRAGVRIAVSAKGGNDLYLSRTLKNAQLVRATGGAAAFKLFVSDKLEAYAGLRPALIERSATLPGSRVLDGRYTVIQYSIGTPAGRDTGARYLRGFIEHVKASGFVAQSIEKNGARGVTLAPSQTVQIGGGQSYEVKPY